MLLKVNAPPLIAFVVVINIGFVIKKLLIYLCNLLSLIFGHTVEKKSSNTAVDCWLLNVVAIVFMSGHDFCVFV